MRRFIIFSVLFVFLFINLIVGAEYPSSEYRKFDTLGRAPLFSKGIWTPNQVRYLVLELERNMVGQVILKSGYGRDLVAALILKVNGIKIRDVMIQPGQRIEAMGWKSRSGERKIITKLEWVGKPFPAFVFEIPHQNGAYMFMIPKKCGNICTLGFRDLPLSPAIEPEPEPEPEIEEEEVIEEIIRIIPEPVVEEKKERRIGVVVEAAVTGAKNCFYGFGTGGIGPWIALNESRNTRIEIIPEVNFPFKATKDSKLGERFFSIKAQLRQKVIGPFHLFLGGAYSGKAVEYQKAFWEALGGIEIGPFYGEIRVPTEYLDELGDISLESHQGPPWKFQLGLRVRF